MGAKYTATSVSGYNSSPPSDDGSVSEANKVKWSTIKTKLPDPIKTALESIDTKLTTWATYGPTSITEATTLVAADNEKFTEVTSACTMTLADASTLGAGWLHYIVNTSSGNVTLARATGGDTLDGVASNGTLAAGDAVALVVNAAANGFLSFGKRKSGTLGTEQATTSGSSIEFTGIPAGTKQIIVTFEGVSTSGTNLPGIQLGDAGGYESSGYVGGAAILTNGVTPTYGALSGGAFHFATAWGPSQTASGTMTLTLKDAANFTWAATWQLSMAPGSEQLFLGAGVKSLSAQLNSIKFLTSDTFDAGSINILYY